MKFQLRTIAAAVALLFASSSFTRAVDITFDFSTLTTGQSSYTMTSGAYSLLLSNPVNMGFSSTFLITSNGMDFGIGSITPLNAGFSMQVTGGPLDFKNYDISFNPAGVPGSFSLTGGTGTSTGNLMNPAGTYNFNGSYRISPGDTVALNASVSKNIFMKSITFSTVTVPEPSTYALGVIATGVMAYVARRRRKQANKTA
jgi:hypothetical protein